MRIARWIFAIGLVACSSSGSSPSWHAASDDAGDDAGTAGDDGGDPGEAGPPTCDAGAKTGSAKGGSVTAPGGLNVVVRVPAGYDPTIASPFVMVFAPAGGDAAATEQFTGYTPVAMKRGYIIAYADHVSPTTMSVIKQAAQAIPTVTGKWCVDPKRIYLTGHSDGGTVAELTAYAGYATVAAIAPSASGVTASNLAAASCPKAPISAMEIHSTGDQLFPVSQGFGADVAKSWAKCESCASTPGPKEKDGCIPYPGCAGGTEVRYCEGSAPHGYWPPAADPPPTDSQIFDFFDRHTAP
jgi:polyhydroxybutyrate depolymerase